jgi:hypothetical protein
LRLSAILLLVLVGIIVWSTMRMSRRREDARRERDRGSGGETTAGNGSDSRDPRGAAGGRGDSHDGNDGGD